MNAFVRWAKKMHACEAGRVHAGLFAGPQDFWNNTESYDYMRWVFHRLRRLKLINYAKYNRICEATHNAAFPFGTQFAPEAGIAKLRELYPKLPIFKFGQFWSQPAYAAKMAGRKRTSKARGKRAGRRG